MASEDVENDVTLTVKVYGIEWQADLDDIIDKINTIGYVSDVRVVTKLAD